jgi:hypothetical protein
VEDGWLCGPIAAAAGGGCVSIRLIHSRMRSPKAISVGNGWYWLAGVLVGLWFYVAIILPVLPAIAWHRTHSRKMQFAEFRLDVPLLWSVPKADFQQPNDISIDKATLPRNRFPSSIFLTRTSQWDRGLIDVRTKELMESYPAWSEPKRLTYALASGPMDCSYRQALNSLVQMSCFSERTGSTLFFLGSKRDYLQLHDIVR